MQLKQAVSLDGCAVFLMDSAAELARVGCMVKGLKAGRVVQATLRY